MSNSLLLNSTIMAVSLSNTILMLWLGLTVLLNAERRTWGAWIAGIGLLMGGIFFISHTAIIGYGFNESSQGLNFWWRVGWIPMLGLPFIWYMMMLWYVGYWEYPDAPIHQRHRIWFILAILLVIITYFFAFFANPIPSFAKFTLLGLQDTISVGTTPLIVLVFLLYIVLCICLSLDALRRPEPSARVMGELARERARPWLVGTSISFLLVSFLVAWVMIWVAQLSHSISIISRDINTLAIFDLSISILICIAVILLGQAVVAYEIFTGKALPRRGFLRHWRLAIILSIGYGVFVGFSFYSFFRPIYSLLLTAILMTLFYALLSWRSYTERERYIEHLRPFVANQGLFDQLLTHGSAASPEVDVQSPFNALCKEVLDAKVAYLVALGPLSPLVNPAMCYPPYQHFEPSGLHELSITFTTPEPRAIRIDPSIFSQAAWAVPLWSERGLIGVLLLGEKRDGGLFTQEEIEIAQTSCERLIDTKASAEIAQRLMSLQRQRLAESQLLDQRARRVLHDEVLQQLHTAMLKLVAEKSKPNGGTSEAIELLAGVHGQVSDLLRDMPTTSLPEIKNLGLIGALRKLIDEEMGSAFESIKWKIDLQAERFTFDISPLTAEVLYYAAREAIRNAAKYGREDQNERPLHLTIHFLWREGLEIQVEDDGTGISTEHTIDLGSGQGLALHSTMMAVVGGELAVESEPGEYTKVSLILPQGA